RHVRTLKGKPTCETAPGARTSSKHWKPPAPATWTCPSRRWSPRPWRPTWKSTPGGRARERDDRRAPPLLAHWRTEPAVARPGARTTRTGLPARGSRLPADWCGSREDGARTVGGHPGRERPAALLCFKRSHGRRHGGLPPRE